MVNITGICNLLEENDKIKFTNDLLKTFDELGLSVLSKADFEAYLYYLLKKHKNQKFDLNKFDWIRLLKDTDYLSVEEADSLLKDVDELLRIIGSIQKKLRNS